MAFNPDEYLAGFNPDQYLSQFNPDEYLGKPTVDLKAEGEQYIKNTQGFLESVGSVLRGMPGYTAGGLTGLGAAISGQGIDEAARQQQFVQEKLDEFFGAKPKTPEGQKYTEALSQAFKYPIEKAAEIGETIAGSEGRLATGIAAETLLNFMPLHAGKKALTKERKPVDFEAKPKEPNQILENLDKQLEPGIVPEEAMIESQQVRGRQFGGENVLGVEFPELRPQRQLPLELLPEDQYPISDRGVRTKDTVTGKVVQGMDESVPTIDFPLRQEVLQQPEIKAAIDAFRLEAERLRQINDEAGLARLQSEFMAGMRQLGIYSPQDALGLQKLWESVSKGDLPALRYPEGIRKGGEINPKLTETEIPPIVDELSKQFNKAPLSVLKKQRGAIDPEVFREGAKRLTRALSKLTDKLWLKERFPATAWMTNSDGTPLVMLHGTDRAFDRLKPSYEGIHAGFTVPSHLIREEGRRYIYEPAKAKRTLRKEDPINTGFNIRPIAIKKGVYPLIETDFGSWNAAAMIRYDLGIWYKGKNYSNFFSFLQKLAEENNKPPISRERFNLYSDKIDRAWGVEEQNRLFSQLLKEAGVDGFFYENTAESIKRAGRYSKLESPPGYTTSFVTWNADNVKSIFEPAPKKPFVPKKQKGAIDPDIFGISKLAEKIRGTFTTELAKGDHQTAVFEDLPISRDLKDALIPDDVSVAQVKEEALKVQDTTPGSALVGGSHMLAEIKNHPIVYATTQWFNNAGKRAQFLIREHLTPVKETLNSVLQKQVDAELLHGIFMKELKLEKRFSPEELRAAGVNEDVISAYTQLRKAFDFAHKIQNDALVSLGKKPLTFREAYIASRWGGNWRTPVYDKSGKLVWYISEATKKQTEAALKYLAENYPELDITKSKISYRPSTSKESGIIEAGYKEMLKLLDPEDPRVATLKSIYEDFVTTQGVSTLGQSKHFEPKAGIRGFAGERPWAKADIKEMFKQQVRYLENAITWAEMQKAVTKAKEIFSDPELIEKAPNAITLGKEIAKNRLGFGEAKIISSIENAVAESLGVSPSTLAKVVGYPRMLFYWAKLGFMNLSYTTISVIQPIFTIPWHIKLSIEGFKHNPYITFTRSMLDALGFILEHEGTLKNVKMTDLGRRAAKYGIDNGIIDINTLSDIADLGRSKFIQEAERIITFNMVYSERLARSIAFMHFVHHLDQSGVFKGKELEMFQRAEELTNLSMADYRVHERAPIFNKLGLSGSALSTLNTFKINQFNQLYKLAKDGYTTGNYMPFLSLLALQLAMGGAMGFFGINTVDQAWEYFKALLPDKLWMKVKDASIKEALIKAAINNPEKSWLVYGGASALTGVNLSSRYDAGTIVEPSLEGILPFVSDLGNQLQKVWELAMDPGSPVKQAQATHALLPSSLKGLYEANSNVFYDEKTGIAAQVSDPLQGVYRRSPQEQTIRKFGFTSLGEAKEKELKFRMASKEAQRRERLRNTSEKLKEAVIFGTPERVGELYERYINLNGTIPDLQKMFGEAFVRRMTTKLEQMKLKAKTESGAMRYKEYVR